MDEPFPGVFRHDGDLWTANRVPGETVYSERTMSRDGTAYRRWDPHRSKAAAAITKGLRTFPVARDDTVLYLGASTGTTVSHLSDVVADGIVHAVEYAPTVARILLGNMESRDNVAPIQGDARTPGEYASLCNEADLLYQDVAQQDQIAIIERNANMFLADDGYAFLAIKAQSISSTDDPRDVFADAKEQLQDTFDIVEGTRLEPFHTDHLFLVLRPR